MRGRYALVPAGLDGIDTVTGIASDGTRLYLANASRMGGLLHVPAEQAEHLEDDVTDVAEAARVHGIGVVTATNPSDYETWEEREEARRTEPDPERLNTFIATQLCDTTRNAISIRLR